MNNGYALPTPQTGLRGNESMKTLPVIDVLIRDERYTDGIIYGQEYWAGPRFVRRCRRADHAESRR